MVLWLLILSSSLLARLALVPRGTVSVSAELSCIGFLIVSPSPLSVQFSSLESIRKPKYCMVCDFSLFTTAPNDSKSIAIVSPGLLSASMLSRYITNLTPWWQSSANTSFSSFVKTFGALHNPKGRTGTCPDCHWQVGILQVNWQSPGLIRSLSMARLSILKCGVAMNWFSSLRLTTGLKELYSYPSWGPGRSCWRTGLDTDPQPLLFHCPTPSVLLLPLAPGNHRCCWTISFNSYLIMTCSTHQLFVKPWHRMGAAPQPERGTWDRGKNMFQKHWLSTNTVFIWWVNCSTSFPFLWGTWGWVLPGNGTVAYFAGGRAPLSKKMLHITQIMWSFLVNYASSWSSSCYLGYGFLIFHLLHAHSRKPPPNKAASFSSSCSRPTVDGLTGHLPPFQGNIPERWLLGGPV